MSDRPTTPGPGPDPGHERELARLLARYGETWQIERHPDLPVLTATHRSQDGRHIRVLVAHTAAELRAKLETASVVEP